MTEKTRRARMVEKLTEMGVPFAGTLYDSPIYTQLRPLLYRAFGQRMRRLRCRRKRR